VSDTEKAVKNCQITIQKMTVRELLMKCRKRRDDVKTGGKSLTRDKSGGNLFTDQAASGTKVT